jgi:hypothetical protein
VNDYLVIKKSSRGSQKIEIVHVKESSSLYEAQLIGEKILNCNCTEVEYVTDLDDLKKFLGI